jgi:hypothetical protein
MLLVLNAVRTSPAKTFKKSSLALVEVPAFSPNLEGAE